MTTSKHLAPHHAKAIAPDLGYHVDQHNQRHRIHPSSPATVGPHTLVIMAGHPVERAGDIYKKHGGKFPDHIAKKLDNHHPMHSFHKLAQIADKHLPPANSRPMPLMGGDPMGMPNGAPPPGMPPPGPANLPMPGGM